MNYFSHLINQFSDYFNVKYTTKAEALSAVQSHGFQLQHASIALKNDREVVMAAVSNDGYALKYASDAFRADKSVVLEAMKRDIS
ncbi:MAG: DUF4116 domain-containing protein, partial [Gammaproteobacteria bacterium]|nr:DUF4116 domain-containing protein [Gammaproteobacteria bacterium]